MDFELVSVIIPNYNYAEYLRESIESVINQDYPNIEIIVVDDGSSDDSRKILNNYLARAMVLEIDNSGAPTARNFGLIHSKGAYIAYLDSDDFWEKSKISKQMKRLKETNTELVYCRIRILDVETNTFTSSNEKREGSFKGEFLRHPSRTPFAPSAVLMKRELVAKVGMWDTSFKSPAEDFDYFRRCSKYSNFSVVDEELVTHRNHSMSLTAKSLKRYYLDNRLGLIKLFADEYPQLRLLDRRKSWIRFNLQFIKSFLKSRDLGSTLYCILQCVLPINI
jgi:glycosyltransferase involved in cell wall biosynthesis